MARRAVSERRKRIVDHLARMLVQWLNIHAFKDLTVEEMSRRIGLTVSVANVPWWTDIPEICEAAGLDIGLTVRDAKGNEVTFWPSENFGDKPKVSKVAGKKVESLNSSQQTTVYLPALGSRVHRR